MARLKCSFREKHRLTRFCFFPLNCFLARPVWCVLLHWSTLTKSSLGQTKRETVGEDSTTGSLGGNLRCTYAKKQTNLPQQAHTESNSVGPSDSAVSLPRWQNKMYRATLAHNTIKTGSSLRALHCESPRQTQISQNLCTAPLPCGDLRAKIESSMFT